MADREMLDPGINFNSEISSRGLWDSSRPLRLHLGCGEQRLDGYINVDYPPALHSVMRVRADVFTDITRMVLEKDSVDEIRLHHVFEHFSRVTALAMIIRWHEALRHGGTIHIETPDLEGSARLFLGHSSWKVKMGTARHLAGDQAAGWAYHVDHWFPDRFRRTLDAMGFDGIETKQFMWAREPHLCNVEVKARKARELSRDELLSAADAILWESTVGDAERPMFEIWRRQLREVMSGAGESGLWNTTAMNGSSLLHGSETASDPELPIEEIYNFSKRSRDRWIADKAARVPTGSRVLYIGPGTCPYRSLFQHCDYHSHDLKGYDGGKHQGNSGHGMIDYVSDVFSIPVEDASFDTIVGTEVLEHVPEPIEALKEISRILRKGGNLLLAAPFVSGSHQLPFRFYGGHTLQWYRHFCGRFGLDIVEIIPNRGLFERLAQDCVQAVAPVRSQKARLGPQYYELNRLLSDTLPRIFFDLDRAFFDENHAFGHFVEAKKYRNNKI